MPSRHLLLMAAGLIAAVLFAYAAQAQNAPATLADTASDARQRAYIGAPVPDFSGVWFRAWKQAQLFDPPESGPGPITGDSAWPHARGVNAPWIADLRSPILQPKTRARLEELGEQQKAGHAILDNDSLCLPLGVLASLNLFDAMQVLQTPTEVTFLYARDHQVRFVYLNRPHSKTVGPSWYGESVGHYEGDILVVDTIGMNEKTLVDRYGTPHSDQLHTVERYRISGNDGVLQVTVTVEDPIAFTTPWTAKVDYRHEPSSTFEEIVCAENNQGIAVPRALKADF